VICTKVVRKLSGCFIKGIASLSIIIADFEIAYSRWTNQQLAHNSDAHGGRSKKLISVDVIFGRNCTGISVGCYFSILKKKKKRKKETKIKIYFAICIDIKLWIVIQLLSFLKMGCSADHIIFPTSVNNYLAIYFIYFLYFLNGYRNFTWEISRQCHFLAVNESSSNYRTNYNEFYWCFSIECKL
jgi:hypothetical protein